MAMTRISDGVGIAHEPSGLGCCIVDAMSTTTPGMVDTYLIWMMENTSNDALNGDLAADHKNVVSDAIDSY